MASSSSGFGTCTSTCTCIYSSPCSGNRTSSCTGNRLGCSSHFMYQSPYKNQHVHLLVHPGSSAMLDHIVRALRLAPGKLAASRTVVREYGNMLGATVIFVLDEVRRQREDPEGEGASHDEDWGVMMGFGPGFTVETMLLHAAT
uniref:Chalcone synthase n=1 Tax=Aegilops tauschii TaxID=37682 RepID=M8BXL0_AEGTA